MTTYQFTADDADIILRASRCDVPREFRVHKIILSMSSPVFKDMFNIPQPVSSDTHAESAVPVIEIDHAPEELETFLHMIYPFQFPSMPTLDAISRALVILDKYGVRGGPLQVLKDLLVSPDFLENHPIQVYSIACWWKFKHEADVAAPYTSSLDVLSSARTEDIQRMTGMEYHRILILSRQRGINCEDCIRNLPSTCIGCDNSSTFYKNYRSRLLDSFKSDRWTFYDYRRCVIRCFEIAIETEKLVGPLGCGISQDSDLGRFVGTLSKKLSSNP